MNILSNIKKTYSLTTSYVPFYIKWLNSFLRTKIWETIAKFVIGKLGFRLVGYPKFDLGVYFEMRKIILSEPDKFFCVVGTDTLAMSYKCQNLFSKPPKRYSFTDEKGNVTFSHAVVLYPQDGEIRLLQMIGPGMFDWWLLNYLREVDKAALVEIPMSPENVKIANKRLAKAKATRKLWVYDFALDLISENIVEFLDSEDPTPKPGTKLMAFCSELGYLICYGLSKKFVPDVIAYKTTFTPDMLADAGIIRLMYDGSGENIKKAFV